ncbi:MAG: Ig-like domain-containing protein [Desulfovibrionaceae bacterium]|nr:Ig-like domain-containing protein [Desulfovibrionaceae bacterium]
MAEILLARPASANTESVVCAPDSSFALDFPADAVTVSREGDDLVFIFEDGARLRLQGFYQVASPEDLPSFVTHDGQTVSGADWLAQLGNPDLLADPPQKVVLTSGCYMPGPEADVLGGQDALGGVAFEGRWSHAALRADRLPDAWRTLDTNDAAANGLPQISALGPDAAIASGTLRTGSWAWSFGSDTPLARSVTVSGAAGTGELSLTAGSSLTLAGTSGTLTVSADGTWAYQASPNSAGSDAFTLTIRDADNDAASADLTLSVYDSTQTFAVLEYGAADTDSPDPSDPSGGSAGGASGGQSGGLTGSGSGAAGRTVTAIAVPDGVTLTGEAIAEVNDSIDYGRFSLDEESGELVFTQTAAWTFGDEESHTYPEVVFPVTDANGNSTVLRAEVTIRDGQPAISLAGAPEDSVDSGTSASGSWTYDFGTDMPESAIVTVAAVGGEEAELDLDGETGSLTAAGLFGTLVLAADGTWTYRASPNSQGTDVFTLSLVDADGDAAEATLSISVADSTQTFAPIACVSRDAQVGGEALLALPAGVTLSEEAVAAANSSLSFGYFELDAGAGMLSFFQTAAFAHAEGTGSAVIPVSFQATDANGNATTLTVELTVADDVPTLTATGARASESAQGASVPGEPFDLTDMGEDLACMQRVRSYSFTESGTSLGLAVSAAVLVHTGETDAWGSAAYTFADTDTAYLNYRAGTASDGLSVSYYEDGAERNNVEVAFWKEYQQDGSVLSRSEALVFDLDGLACGVRLDFLNLYKAGGTGIDSSDERALVSYYRDGVLVYSAELRADSLDGQASTELQAADFIAQGFDRVVVSSLDNGASVGADNSDFTLESISFVTLDAAILTYTGTVSAQSGADGWLSASASHAALDYSSDSAAWDSLTVLLADGTVSRAELRLVEGNQGGGRLTAVSTAEDGTETDLFSVILSADGSWRFDQYTAFAVLDGSGSWRGTYDIAFVSAADSDGDTGSVTQRVTLAESDALDAAVEALAAMSADGPDLADAALADEALSGLTLAALVEDGASDRLLGSLTADLTEPTADSSGDLADSLGLDTASADSLAAAMHTETAFDWSAEESAGAETDASTDAFMDDFAGAYDAYAQDVQQTAFLLECGS